MNHITLMYYLLIALSLPLFSADTNKQITQKLNTDIPYYILQSKRSNFCYDIYVSKYAFDTAIQKKQEHVLGFQKSIFDCLPGVELATVHFKFDSISNTNLRENTSVFVVDIKELVYKGMPNLFSNEHEALIECAKVTKN
jgi:hypothetical protein